MRDNRFGFACKLLLLTWLAITGFAAIENLIGVERRIRETHTMSIERLVVASPETARIMLELRLGIDLGIMALGVGVLAAARWAFGRSTVAPKAGAQLESHTDNRHE